SPDVENYVNGLNPAGGGTLLISATSGFGTCSLPMLAEPADGVPAIPGIPDVNPSSTVPPSVPTPPAGGTVVASTATSVATALTQAELNVMVAAALQRWKQTGLTAEQSAVLEQATFTVSTALPGAYLGAESPGHVDLSASGGGYGWFVDASPNEDSEFPVA